MLGELGYSLAHHYFTSSDVKVKCNKCATITKTTVAIVKKKAFKCWGCVELSMLDSIRRLLPDKSWFLPSGFKNLSAIPPDVISKWRAWGKQIIVEAEKVSIPGKGKYAMVTGRTAKEKKNLLTTFLAANRQCAYPKRSTIVLK